MNDVNIRTQIMETLYARRAVSPVGAIDVPNLAQEIGQSSTRVAVVCNDLILHKHVDGDGNLMGAVRLSDAGVAYYEQVKRLEN